MTRLSLLLSLTVSVLFSSGLLAQVNKTLTGKNARILFTAMEAASPALTMEKGKLVSGKIFCSSLGGDHCEFFPLNSEDSFFDETSTVTGNEAFELSNLIRRLAGNGVDVVQIKSAKCTVSRCSLELE